jgi:hypothetical protein
MNILLKNRIPTSPKELIDRRLHQLLVQPGSNLQPLQVARRIYRCKNTSLRPSPNTQFHSYLQDPQLDTCLQVLQKTLLQLYSLPGLAGLPQSRGECYYYRVAGNGTVFPVTSRIRESKLTNIRDGRLA